MSEVDDYFHARGNGNGLSKLKSFLGDVTRPFAHGKMNSPHKSPIGSASKSAYTVRPELSSGGYRGSTFIPPEAQPDDLFRDMVAQLMADRENSRDQSSSNINSWATQDLSALGKPYDVQIGALDDLGDRARRDTKQNSGDVQALYAALTRSIDDRNAGLQGDFQRTTDSMVNLGQGNADSQAAYAQNLLNRNAQSSTILDPGQQEKLLAELNGPVTQAAQVGGNNALSLANQYAQRNTAQKGSANQFFNHLATGSTIEGTNRAADMMQKLQDYLVDIQNQQAGLGADKAAAITGARGDLLSGLAKSSTDANNYYMQNGLDIAKMVMSNAQNEAENDFNLTKLQTPGNTRDSEAKALNAAQMFKIYLDAGYSKEQAQQIVNQQLGQ